MHEEHVAVGANTPSADVLCSEHLITIEKD